MIRGGETASERNLDIRVEARPPHENEILPKLVQSGFVFISFLRFRRLVEEEFKRLGETSGGIEVFKFIGKNRRVCYG